MIFITAMFYKIIDYKYFPVILASLILLMSIIIGSYTSNTIEYNNIYPYGFHVNPNNSNYIPYDPNYVPTSQGYRVELEGRSLPWELDGRQIYEIDSTQYHNYRAYNPNYIPTSHGYSIELEDTDTKHQYERTKFPTYHNNNSDSSTELGIIPNDAKSEKIGIRENINPNYHQKPYFPRDTKAEYISTPTFCSNVKDKLKTFYKASDRFFEASFQRGLMEQDRMALAHASRLFARGKISKKQLRKWGYIVIRGQVEKLA